MLFNAGKCDIAVIGAGHAGIEAALACARLGLDTVCFTLNLDTVGNLPCNPAIGGTAKGHLVRELDALGGEMAKAADRACIQYRMLNRGKGPAVHSLRAQADRRLYQAVMKKTLETQENLRLRQTEIVKIETDSEGVSSVISSTGGVWRCRAAIITTGTYLGARIIIGEISRNSGPDGLAAAVDLRVCLEELGLSLRRFKTGTPPRINARSVDFSKMELQPGDDEVIPFSFETVIPPENRAPCYLTYTNEATHEIIRANLHRSPLFSGDIKGVGARYCPSIEDKVVRFADKKRHQLFIEPMGLDTLELYVQGFSSSMPEDVQICMLQTVAGLERAEITRSAYAIEYDCADPTQFNAALECKEIPGLYGAGQFLGSSGYEEAAVQGFIAGVNAALHALGRDALVLRRTDGYIGTLIDDLVTKGTNEPYRMMTSRSEYRLLHRQDNADFRLSHYGLKTGLISKERHETVVRKYKSVQDEISRLESTFIAPSEELKAMMLKKGSSPPVSGISLASLIRRPELDYISIAPFDPKRPCLCKDVWEQAEICIKYAGYIERQKKQVEEFSRMEDRLLPRGIDYNSVTGLRTEARQKLLKIRPLNFGQAARISGVSPADMAALMIYLERRG